MKLLCITDCPDRGETELFIQLARRLPAFTVMLNPEARNNWRLEDAGVRTLPLKLRSRFDRSGRASIRQELEAGDYDIVHAFNTHALANLLPAARHHRAKLLGYRGVTTGVGYLKPESWHTFLNPRLDGIFCVAEAVRQSLLAQRLLWWQFPAAKVRTIHKGHELAWYDDAPADLTELGIPRGAARTLCCISRNSSKKGVTDLLEAFDRLDPALDCHLLLIGAVDNNARVRQRANRCVHPERIHFTGYRTDVIAILRAADLLVSASASGEGLPRVIIEAMCTDTPVVATNAGGTRELVQDGVTGLLVQPGDSAAMAAAIEISLRDLAASAQRVAAARQQIANQFNARQTAASTLQWYCELLETAPILAPAEPQTVS